jgi:hypothetical protein
MKSYVADSGDSMGVRERGLAWEAWTGVDQRRSEAVGMSPVEVACKLVALTPSLDQLNDTL